MSARTGTLSTTVEGSTRPARWSGALTTVLALGLLGGCTTDDPPPSPSPTPTPVADQTVSPPDDAPETAGPQDDGDDGGQDAPTADPDVDQDPAPDAPPPPEAGDGTARVVVTYAGPGSDPETIEVAAYVADVIEQDGTCTATLTGASVTDEAPAFADASSTSCGLMILPAAPAQGQTVEVTYRSGPGSTTGGTSDPTAVAP